MKILFIVPGIGRKEQEPYPDRWQCEPLVFALLKSLTPEDVEVQLYDDRFEEIPYDESVDYVAITVETFTALRAYTIAAEFRKRGVPVIMGGYHVSLIPDEALSYADAIVVGNAESVWSTVIEDMRARKLKRRYLSSACQTLNITFRRDIYQRMTYRTGPGALLMTSRGCPHSCRYCSGSAVYRQSYLVRPVEDVVAEVASFKRRGFFIIDDNLATDTARSKQLFQALIPLKMQWIGQASIDIAKDPVLLALMRKSGCAGLVIGFESLSKDNLQQMGKSVNLKYAEYAEYIRAINGHGIGIIAWFMMGWDDDDESAIKKTVDFAIRQRFLYARFNPIVAYPGTPLYEELRSQGRLLYNSWWLDHRFHYGDVMFRPRQIEPESLSQACFTSQLAFYSFRSITWRSTQVRANWGSIERLPRYLKTNLFWRKATYQEYGVPLALGFDH